MPYAVRGKTVVKKEDGEKVVGHSNKPKKYLRVLQAVEHGWKPTGKKKKKQNINEQIAEARRK